MAVIFAHLIPQTLATLRLSAEDSAHSSDRRTFANTPAARRQARIAQLLRIANVRVPVLLFNRQGLEP